MKFIELDQEAERILTALCDHALKGGGMQSYSIVDQLIALIKQSEEKESNE